MNSIRNILSLVAVEDFHVEQLDIKMTFLHGDLEEYIYMQHPYGYEFKGVEINPNLKSIELTKLLEKYARNTQKET